MPVRILGGGRTCGVFFRSFSNSPGWCWLISSVFLTRTSCHKTTHANGYYDAWPGWAVSVSVLPLTTVLPETSNSRYFMGIGVEVSFFLSYLHGLLRQPFCIAFSWRWSWSLPPVQCHGPPSIVLQGLCLSDLALESICHIHCIIIRALI